MSELERLLHSCKQLIASTDKSRDEILLEICKTLQSEVRHYNWVGFYFHKEGEKILELGPYVGKPTDHTRIPFGKGICGQVAESNDTFVVQDVQAQDNYIACSIEVKSEIVVPIFVNGRNIGQIDIDSNHEAPFKPEDSAFLEALCAEIGARLF